MPPLPQARERLKMELFLPDRISLNLIRWTLSPSFIHLMDCASGKGLFDGNLGRSIYETALPWTERPERQRTASAADRRPLVR